MHRCPSCNYECFEKEVVCKKCGTSLPPPQHRLPLDPLASLPAMVGTTCPRCGTQLVPVRERLRLSGGKEEARWMWIGVGLSVLSYVGCGAPFLVHPLSTRYISPFGLMCLIAGVTALLIGFHGKTREVCVAWLCETCATRHPTSLSGVGGAEKPSLCPSCGAPYRPADYRIRCKCGEVLPRRAE